MKLGANFPQIPSCSQTMSPVHFKGLPLFWPQETSPPLRSSTSTERPLLLLSLHTSSCFFLLSHMTSWLQASLLGKEFHLVSWRRATDMNDITKRHKKWSKAVVLVLDDWNQFECSLKERRLYCKSNHIIISYKCANIWSEVSLTDYTVDKPIDLLSKALQ